MCRHCHQNGANDEHYDIHLQCPFAANTLSDYLSVWVTKQGIDQATPLTEVAKQGTKECTCLESRSYVARDAGSCGFGDAKVLLETGTGDRGTHEGWVIPKAGMMLAHMFLQKRADGDSQ
jgi:hypothetical protein